MTMKLFKGNYESKIDDIKKEFFSIKRELSLAKISSGSLSKHSLNKTEWDFKKIGIPSRVIGTSSS